MSARFPRFVLLVVLGGCAKAAILDEPTRMDQILRSYVANNQFIGTVLVARANHILLSKGYGFANFERKTPNTPETKFRLGSLTKQFTAAAVLMLEEGGKLRTDDLISKYLPDVPKSWSKVRISHLLTHTSGIPSFTSLPSNRVPRLPELPLEFEPGTKWKYSNSGYIVLGELIERVSGIPYGQFVRENIFTPIGMNDSGYESNASIIERRASGYRAGGKGTLINAAYIDMSLPFAAGALYSTTGDLLKWETALFGGKVVSAASLTKLTTPFKNNYAFGLYVEQRGGHKLVWHKGGINGFTTELHYWPDQQIVVVVLANEEGSARSEIAAKLDELAREDSAAPAAGLSPTRHTTSRFASTASALRVSTP